MSCVLEPLRSRPWSRAAVLALMTIGVAACSGEASRFGDNSNKGNPDATGSIPQAQAAPVGRVESRPLPPQTAQLPPHPGASGPSTVASSSGVAGGGKGMASYTPGPSGASPYSQNQYNPGPARPAAAMAPD